MYIPLTFEGALQKCLIASSSYQGTFISGGVQYGYHAFTSSGNFEVYNGSLQAQVIVVGGGGGGGTNGRASGGGGGGQVIYLPTQQLYAGTYNISIGVGGLGGTPISAATAGSTTTIGGNNLLISAVGGQPAFGSTGGASGNGFSGGTGCSNVSANGGSGGGGGGSTAAALNANCAQPTIATDGGTGFSFSSANRTWSFGCGGGGGSSSGNGGNSCYGGDGFGNPGTDGGPNTGNGGGGSWLNGGTCTGGDGGSGVVIIQYPINDYCKNFFNETGSCGCTEVTFDITDPLNYYPQHTGRYQYTPCGSSTFVSGTIQAYYPLTVCAASASYYWVTGSSGYGNANGVLITGGAQCSSASYGVETCTTQSFQSTCSSSFVTFVAGTGSTSPQTLYYVPKLSSSIVYETLTNNYVTYKCVSRGGSFDFYPYGISGVGSTIFTTAACNTVTFTNTFGVTKTYKYWNCNGQYTQASLGGYASASICIDTTLPYGFYGDTSNTNVTVGGDCLGSVIYTGSCGCNSVSQTYSIIQNCSSSVTATALFSGSYYPSTGFTFVSNTSGLSGSCWNVIGTASFEAFPTYSNVVTQSSFTNCTDCEIARVGSGSISWSFTESSQDGLFTIYDNANTITTLSGSGTGNTNIPTGHYVTASLTPVNYPTSGAIVMNIYANGTAVTQSIGSSELTTITSSFLIPSGSRTSITASITYYPGGLSGFKSYVFKAGPSGGTATYRLPGATTNTSRTLSSGSSIQVCSDVNYVSITGTDSKQFIGPDCGNIITASCNCNSASFTAGILPPYAVQYIPCSSSVFSYVILDYPETFSGCISYPSSSLATAGQGGSPTSNLTISGSCKSGNCP